MYTSFHSKFDDNSQDLSQNEYGYIGFKSIRCKFKRQLVDANLVL